MVITENIEIGFGVVVEVINNEHSKIHNLKSEGKSISNLGVRMKW